MIPCSSGIGDSNVYDNYLNSSTCNEGLSSNTSPNELTDKDEYTAYEDWTSTQSDLFGFSANVKEDFPFVPE